MTKQRRKRHTRMHNTQVYELVFASAMTVFCFKKTA